MTDPSIEELARRCFAAYDAADREAMERLLAPDFLFTSPYDDHIHRDAYFQRCWPGAGTFLERHLLHVVTEGSECFVLYEASSTTGSLFRNTELFRGSGSWIVSIEVFFGLPPARK